jgi:hypothetical protein
MTKTVKVRIPVAVDPKGRWYAHGWRNYTDQGPINHDQLLEVTDFDTIGPNEALYWITAELPIPQIEEVTGAVSNGER